MFKKLNLKELGEFIDLTFSGRLNEDRIYAIREKLITKRIISEENTVNVINLRVNGLIVSNH